MPYNTRSKKRKEGNKIKVEVSSEKRQKVKDVRDSSKQCKVIKLDGVQKKSESHSKNKDQTHIPDYDRTKHSRAETLMNKLRRMWNKLNLKRESKEHSNYMQDMRSVTGGWTNPDGEDDRARFSRMYFELLPSQRFVFQCMCSEYHYPLKIPKDKVEMYFKYRQTPFYVDESKQEMKLDKSNNYRDGSESYPFYSIQEAKEADEYCECLHVKCKSTCIKKKCPHPECDTYVCMEHGNGIMNFSDSKECFTPQLDQICFDCGTVVCEKHSEELLKKCEACARGASIEACVGEYYSGEICCIGPGRVNYLCRRTCGRMCGKVDEDFEEEDEIEDEDEIEYYNEYEYYEREMYEFEHTCHLICCQKCLEVDHSCSFHDDPREYL